MGGPPEVTVTTLPPASPMSLIKKAWKWEGCLCLCSKGAFNVYCFVDTSVKCLCNNFTSVDSDDALWQRSWCRKMKSDVQDWCQLLHPDLMGICDGSYNPPGLLSVVSLVSCQIKSSVTCSETQSAAHAGSVAPRKIMIIIIYCKWWWQRSGCSAKNNHSVKETRQDWRIDTQ